MPEVAGLRAAFWAKKVTQPPLKEDVHHSINALQVWHQQELVSGEYMNRAPIASRPTVCATHQ